MELSDLLNTDSLILVLLVVLLVLAYQILQRLKNDRKTNGDGPPPTDDKPSDQDLIIRKDPERKRWVLINRETNELAHRIVVKAGNKIKYTLEAEEDVKAHVQFPSQDIFEGFEGVDCFIPDPIDKNNPSTTVRVRGTAPETGLFVYSIAICPDVAGVSTPYVLGGTPPKVEVIPE